MAVISPLIASSARRHDIFDKHMIHAFNNPILTENMDEGFTMFVGPDPAGNLLEIGVIDSESGQSSSTR